MGHQNWQIEKDRQHKGIRANNNLQNTTHKTKDLVTRTSLKMVVNSGAPLVEPVVLPIHSRQQEYHRSTFIPITLLSFTSTGYFVQFLLQQYSLLLKFQRR